MVKVCEEQRDFVGILNYDFESLFLNFETQIDFDNFLHCVFLSRYQ